jgi:DNA-binding transcriptional MerR regulator
VRDIDIADVASRSGVPASTLRYYEQEGLIASIGRRGLRRLFDAEALERLALIALGRAAGFSLGEIASMLAPGAPPGSIAPCFPQRRTSWTLRFESSRFFGKAFDTPRLPGRRANGVSEIPADPQQGARQDPKRHGGRRPPVGHT